MTIDERMKRMFAASRAFSPGAPVKKWELFAGRHEQVREVINAVNQRGQHVILFGERGVGKTSLATILSELVEAVGGEDVDVCKVNCDGNDTFESLWRKTLRELTYVTQAELPGFDRDPDSVARSLAELLPDNFTPEDIRYLLQHAGGERRRVLIIDEFDRIQRPSVTTAMADTVKTLSDNSVSATLVLVGVADSVEDLISEHRSIERAIVQIRMPRMSPGELTEILDNGFDVLELRAGDDVRDEIARLSQGLPHYTHLLGLHAAQQAIENGRDEISGDHVKAAVDQAVENAQQSIRRAYHRATSSPRKGTLHGAVLLACAVAETDQLGYFAAVDVRDPLSVIKRKRYEIPAYSRHLNDFCEERRGRVLQKTGEPRRFRFRFVNPLMQPYVIMHGLSSGLVDRATIALAHRKARLK